MPRGKETQPKKVYIFSQGKMFDNPKSGNPLHVEEPEETEEEPDNVVEFVR